MLRQRYNALADAAGSSASPQIRNVATLGGNLLQRPRCWYFRRIIARARAAIRVSPRSRRSTGRSPMVLDCAADGRCGHVAVMLGAAAPMPWRAAQAEAALTGQMIDDAVARKAGEAAIVGAAPLRHNAYKLPIFTALLRRAVLKAAGVTEQENAHDHTPRR